MNISEIISKLEEARTVGSKNNPSSDGDEKKKKAFKGRVRTYNTIDDALSQGQVGQIFTTKGADRRYIVTKGKWGAKSGRGKVAKGFTPGSSDATSTGIRQASARAKIRYGKGEVAKGIISKHGSRNQKKDAGLPY